MAQHAEVWTETRPVRRLRGTLFDYDKVIVKTITSMISGIYCKKQHIVNRRR